MHSGNSDDGGFEAAVAAHQRGDLAAAEHAYRALLSEQPEHPAACNNLGLCLAMSGRPGEAADWFRAARRADPSAVDPAVNLAQALEQSGQVRHAFDAWREAADLLPDQVEPALAAAMLAMDLDRVDDAVTLLERAGAASAAREGTRALLTQRVADVAAHCIEAGDPGLGHRLASLLARLDPADDVAAHLLGECLRHAQIRQFDPGIRDDLLVYHRSDAVEHHELSRVTCELIAAQYPELTGPGAALDRWHRVGAHRDELLERLLVRGRVATAPLERALTALRRDAARAVLDGSLPEDSWQRFVTALALQCVANEHVFSCSDAEVEVCAALEARLAREPRDLDALAIVACYRPLADLPAAQTLAAGDAPLPALTALLLRRTVSEVLAERALQPRIRQAAVGDTVSCAVRRQYEESPYPRWLNLERQPVVDIAGFLGQEIPGFHAPSLLSGRAAILVAGCGTGEHALRVASRHPMCEVTAIDLSLASLAYALRKADEADIDNVRFEQRDILDIAPAEGPFALIESVGVLHHMRDPAAGLAALCRVLAPGGVVKLGLYSRRARRHVSAARERIAALGLDATPQGMRALRARILCGDEPALESLTGSLDFYSLSAVRDLLFHTQEHQFDVAGLRALLDGAGLRCIGFQVPPATRRRYLERHPDDPAMRHLDHLAAFEERFPDTFAGMYQFWCVRARD